MEHWLFAIPDGQQVLPMLGAQDHKRLLDGDHGPNTGGMGAYAPVTIGTSALVDDVVARIFEPTLHALREDGCTFTGLLYAGLMLTADGPKVVEFNCRFGDPETEALLPLLDCSLLDPMHAVASGAGLTGCARLRWSDAHAVTTVVAAAGYPERARAGDAIVLPPDADGVHVFHAGTTRGEDGVLRTAGGRVLAVTGVAPTLAQARERSRAWVEAIELPDRQYRRDIGWREAERHAGAA